VPRRAPPLGRARRTWATRSTEMSASTVARYGAEPSCAPRARARAFVTPRGVANLFDRVARGAGRWRTVCMRWAARTKAAEKSKATTSLKSRASSNADPPARATPARAHDAPPRRRGGRFALRRLLAARTMAVECAIRGAAAPTAHPMSSARVLFLTTPHCGDRPLAREHRPCTDIPPPLLC